MPLKLEGMDGILQKVKRLSNTEEAKQRALDAGAEHFREKYSQNLQRSQANKEHAADHIIVTTPLTDNDKRQIGPTKEHFYVQFVEFGTSKIKADPTMARTFHAEIGEMQRIMKQSLKRDLKL